MSYQLADLASGYSSYNQKYYDAKATPIYKHSKNIINVQLRYWTQALDLFMDLNENDTERLIEDGVLIINSLANSLAFLGGMNWKGPSAKTPSLIELYSGKVWNLKQGDPHLYKEFENLVKDYNTISKHFNPSNGAMLVQINYSTIDKYMQLTNDIWLWVLNEAYGGSVPPEFDEFFTKTY